MAKGYRQIVAIRSPAMMLTRPAVKS